MMTVKVFVVDDLPQIRRELRTILPLAGNAAGLQIEVIGEAGDGHEAIQLVRQLHPEVVLMDLVMPGMDGFTATQIIKQEHPSIKVVVLTVLDKATAERKARLMGADAFVEKGAQVAEIVRSIMK